MIKLLFTSSTSACFEWHNDLPYYTEEEYIIYLNDKQVYSEIVKQTGASTATISRVNRSLSYGTGAYATIFERRKQQQEQEKKADE